VTATVVLAGFAFCVSLLTLFTGFGLGTLLMPAFALFLPMQVAVASTALVHAANNLFKVGLLAGDAHRGVILRFGLPAVVAAFAGAWLLSTLSSQTPLLDWEILGRSARVTPVKLVMGVLILGFSLFELVPKLRDARAPARWLPVGGALSGFFGGLSGHQGALRAAFLAPLGLSPTRFAATQAVLALLVDGARLLVYGWSFALLRDAPEAQAIPWRLVATTTAAAFAGAFLGKRLLHKTTMGGLRRLVGGLLLIVGAALATGIA
jgi:uncharacterized membrane protein YfcA